MCYKEHNGNLGFILKIVNIKTCPTKKRRERKNRNEKKVKKYKYIQYHNDTKTKTNNIKTKNMKNLPYHEFLQSQHT